MADHKVKLILETIRKGKGLELAAREAATLENAVRDLRQELDRSVQHFEDAKSSSIRLRSEWKKMDRSGEATKEMLQAKSREIEKASEVQLEAIRSTQKLSNEIKELGDDSGITSSEIAQLSARLQESERYVTGVGGAAKLAADKSDQLRQSVDKTADGLDRLENSSQDANQSLDKIDDSSSRAASSLKRVENSSDDAANSLGEIEKKVGATAHAMGNILADGLQDAAQAVKDFTLESYESYRDFDEETRRVFAQVPNMSASMRDSLAGDAKVIASQIGRLPQETLPALRKALNLGISEDNLLSSIETASMAARVGGESLIDTMVLGQSVVNAYGGEMYSLSDAYDQLNYITQSSNLEFGDLNANMNEIISAAAEAGIGLDSVAGAMVTMNRQGDDAAEIAGLLSNVLTQISIEGTALGSAFEEAAGVGFREFTAAGGTLAEGLEILQGHAQDTGQDLLDMVGGSSPFYRDVQAARGVLELTGKHAADLATNTEAAAEATGSLAEAAAEFEGSAAVSFDKANASYENLKITFGEMVAGFLDSRGYIDGLNTSLELLNGNLAHQEGSKVDDILEAAKATGDYAEAYEKLARAKEAGNLGGLGEATDQGMTDLISMIASRSHDIASFRAEMEKIGAITGELDDTQLYIWEGLTEVFNQTKTNDTIAYYEALAEIDYWQSEAKISTGAISAEMQYFDKVLDGTHSQLTKTSTVFFGYQESLASFKTHLQELGEHQDRTNRYFEEATEPVENLFDAISDLKTANDQYRLAPWGDRGELDEAVASVEEANQRIEDSYRETAYEIFLAQNGVNESTIAMGVAMGIFTQMEGEARLEFADTNAAIEELILSQEHLKLTDDQLIMATELLIGGLAATPEAAASAALGLGSVAESALRAKSDISGTRDELFYLTEGSPYEASASVDTGDTSSKLGAISGMLDSLNGRRTSSRHTHTNETINVTRNDTSGGDNKSGGKSDPTPQYSGGNMLPGQAYLVGDTPSGNPTPYSEILIPQQPMTNLGVVGSQDLLNGQQGGSITINNHFYGPVDESAADEIADRQEQSVTEAAQQIGWVMS